MSVAMRPLAGLHLGDVEDGEQLDGNLELTC
jgi:hypothetical protein